MDQFDLSFLKGYAIILPDQHLRVHEKGEVPGGLGAIFEKGDHLIKTLCPYKSPQFTNLHNNIDGRLETLFNIKDKWTYKEISSYNRPFTDTETDQKYDLWLSKNTKLHKEANPFNPKIIT